LRRAGAVAIAIATAIATVSMSALVSIGCGGEEGRPAVTPVAPPQASAPPPPVPSATLDASAPIARPAVEDAAAQPPVATAPPPLPEPSFGATESAKPGDPHPFRVVAALRAMRASRSGANVLTMLSVMPGVIDAHAQTGIDPFSDGDWLLVYGPKVSIPGPNANVVKHARSEAQVTKAIADAGLPAWDAGAGTPGTAVRSELFGVRDVLLRPQPGIVALVPGDRASDLAAVLAKPIDPGVKPGELARIFVAEPAKLARFLPAEVVRANVVVKAAADGGLDLGAEADCPDAKVCKATATELEELVKRSNSMMVRIILKGLLSNLVVRADGTKLKATLHAEPGQVDAVLNITRVQLGLPAADPRDPNGSPHR
jgi:hypothetical protein